ncbi:OprD family porin [Pseudomonas syringae]|uniref:OprD family porin n=1 Tax=Pseudomonas syringae TaxID=317 RepID=UPI00215A41B5|nr:OprD family porin [Pseudomonas syringae]MCR8718244.1 OprD family porin [Pseudomonas syringae]
MTNAFDAENVAWKTAINGYRTTDSGSAKAGNIDNTAVSAALTATHQAHSLTLSYQQIFGNEYFDYLHETAGIYLANAAFSDFNGPNEKSLRVRYETDWARFGIPGWTTAIYYVTGWDIDGTHYNPGAGNYANYADVLAMDNEKHHEVGIVTTYVVQSGALKNSRFNFRVTDHIASNHQVDGNVREVRMVSTFPFDFL